MKRLLILTAVAMVSLTATLADDSADQKAARKERFRQRRENALRYTGGRIVKPGSQQGKIRFVSSVKDMDVTVLEKQYGTFKRRYPFDIATVAGEPVTVETAAAARKRSGFALAVYIMEAPFSAPMLTAPEEGWAIVNHRVCGTPERTAKQAVKAFAYIAGAANTTYGVTFLSSTRPQELDSIATIDFPVDVSECIRKQLAIVNVTPEIKTTYRDACRQGWAPAPTNEYQKAVWDKVHALPTKPIKILPEKTKVTE